MQILNETCFLLKLSLLCPTWCLASDSAISKSPGLNQPHPEGGGLASVTEGVTNQVS